MTVFLNAASDGALQGGFFKQLLRCVPQAKVSQGRVKSPNRSIVAEVKRPIKNEDGTDEEHV